METELEKGGRCGGRGEKGELIYSKEENYPIQVTAMVERVVKRQAELGVDIVTDGEVVSLSNADFPLLRWGEKATTCTF